MSWIDNVLGKLQPEQKPPTLEEAGLMLEFHNLVRKARGLPPETAADRVAAWVPMPPEAVEAMARKLDEARAKVALEEAFLTGRPNSDWI